MWSEKCTLRYPYFRITPVPIDTVTSIIYDNFLFLKYNHKQN